MRSKLVIIGLLLSSIAAFSQTVSVNYKVFGGAPGETLAPFSVFDATPGKNIVLGAPKQILVQDPANPSKPKIYTFLFWVVPGGPSPVNSLLGPSGPTTNTETIFKVPSGGAHTTAWYQLTGSCPTPPCGEPMSYASAFSEDEDEPIAGTPIASVNPSGLWPVPGDSSMQYVKLSTGPMEITTKSVMEDEKFHLWLPLFPTVATSDGTNLKIASKMTTSAIAFFYHTGPPPPGCAAWDLKITQGEVALGGALSQQPPSAEAIAQAKMEIEEAKAGLLACQKTGNARPKAPVH